jgi:WD40 repeat protein
VPLLGDLGEVFTVAFSPDGKTLAAGGARYTIILWNVSTHLPIAKLPIPNSLTPGSEVMSNIVFSPNGVALAAGYTDGPIILWNVATHQPIGQPLKFDRAFRLAFSPDGKTLAAAEQGNNVILLNVANLY